VYSNIIFLCTRKFRKPYAMTVCRGSFLEGLDRLRFLLDMTFLCQTRPE